MYQTTTLPRTPMTLPGPQPGSETNVEGGRFNSGRDYAHIPWSESPGIEPATLSVWGVRVTGSPKKHCWHMWPHTTYVSNYDTQETLFGKTIKHNFFDILNT
jgi:hypothetical protein